MSVAIRPVQTRREVDRFIKLPWKIYKNNPAWIPPLLLERKQFLNPKKNPYFEHAEVQLFLAERDGEVVGRISAQIDHLHNRTHKEQTGFFGFFESVEDFEVSSALIEEASAWLRNQGMKTLRGPFSFSINEESGLLIEGFEYPPYILMPHNPPYYSNLLEQSGLKKVKDLYGWNRDVFSPFPEEVYGIIEEVKKYPGLKIREVNPKDLKKDVQIIVDVFNSAWSQNWGFVPLTEHEVQKMADDFKLILDPHVALIAEVNGLPVGICVGLPNLNEAIRDLNGRLFPFGFLKLLYRVKRRKIKSGRVILLGIKKEYRGSVLGALSVLFYVEIGQRGRARGFRASELSWTLEDNEKINRGIELMGGERYKTYRIYEKSL